MKEKIVAGRLATYRIRSEVVRPRQTEEVNIDVDIDLVAVNVATDEEVRREHYKLPQGYNSIDVIRLLQSFEAQAADDFK